MFIETHIGRVPVADTFLKFSDRFSAFFVRLGFKRTSYRVEPGLYAVGKPDQSSLVLVTANYKLTFDNLRKELQNISAWILVLDTKGVNVWCAAGKGTFSTNELADKIHKTKIGEIVEHRTLILPQLGATGVSAHKVKALTGFKVEYGPILARDIPAYLKAGMKATKEMRRVRFSFFERVKLIPVDLRFAMKGALLISIILGAISFLAQGKSAWTIFPWICLIVFGAVFGGTVIVPALLPFIPFRSFALKGGLVGAALAIIISIIAGFNWPAFIGNVFLSSAIAAFYALNFTGSTTFTSQSGVNKEIRLYARPMGISAVVGFVLIIVVLFLK